ncbi:MAG: zinc ribbon domain-containing protein [Christensenellales bacterium]|jgi:predicted  nucleic acid-binding Zn-ribbon protein
MQQLDILWAFQQKECEIGRIESELKNSQTRKKMIRLRNFVAKQKADLKEFETVSEQMHKRLNEITSEYETLQAQMEGFADPSETEEETDDVQLLSEVKALRIQTEEIQKKLIMLRRELMDIIGKTEKIEHGIRTMAAESAKARKEYSALKTDYDRQVSSAKASIGALREEADEIAKGIPKPLLARYKAIKKNRITPVAIIEDSKCEGCNMELPSLLIQRIKTGEGVMECENCGRILYLTGE